LVIDQTLVMVSRCQGWVRAASRWPPHTFTPIVFDGVTGETVAALEHERDRMTERIDILTRNRDAVANYLAELQQRAND
jgi:hypothetical protein